MGTILSELVHNQVLRVSLIAWLIAQGLKGIQSIIKERRLNFRRFVGAGGMPSSHSAFVTALATSIGLTEGWETTTTALAVVFAFIVMYDASGVRRAAGKQAQVLNKIVDEFYLEGHVREDRLKELLGHTPVEVIAGALLGIVMAALLL